MKYVKLIWQVVACLITILTSGHVLAQPFEQQITPPINLYLEHEAYLDNVKIGMFALTALGVGTAIASSVEFYSTQQPPNEKRLAYQINLIWGATNAFIGVYGIHQILKQKRLLSASQLNDLKQAERIALFEQGAKAHTKAFGTALIFDAVFVAIGGVMIAIPAINSNNSSTNNLLTETGKVVVIQSLALALFDGIMYNYCGHKQAKLKSYLTPAPSGIGLVYHF